MKKYSTISDRLIPKKPRQVRLVVKKKAAPKYKVPKTPKVSGMKWK